MSSSRAPLYHRHILNGIEAIESFTQGVTFEDFRTGPMRVAAVERMLLTISEAAKRLGPEAEALCPGQPWHKIRAVGNWLRHQYDRIDLQSIWDTVTDDLPPLKAAVTLALAPVRVPEPPEPGA